MDALGRTGKDGGGSHIGIGEAQGYAVRVWCRGEQTERFGQETGLLADDKNLKKLKFCVDKQKIL